MKNRFQNMDDCGNFLQTFATFVKVCERMAQIIKILNQILPLIFKQI